MIPLLSYSLLPRHSRYFLLLIFELINFTHLFQPIAHLMNLPHRFKNLDFIREVFKRNNKTIFTVLGRLTSTSTKGNYRITLLLSIITNNNNNKLKICSLHFWQSLQLKTPNWLPLFIMARYPFSPFFFHYLLILTFCSVTQKDNGIAVNVSRNNKHKTKHLLLY